MAERPYLSIGEVLGLLLDEFPDVTISKIRFLESQGLIDPERTASGYRKFYDADVDLLRVILREQRENFLPLKVIRDRLESGAIEDPTGPITPPRGISAGEGEGEPVTEDDGATVHQLIADTPVATHNHPSGAARSGPAGSEVAASSTAVDPAQPAEVEIDAVGAHLMPAELCQRAGLSSEQLSELESFGVIAPHGSGPTARYTWRELAIAKAAAGFMKHGVEARHLRTWRQAAEREANLFEQMVLPLMRQRNPQARQQAVSTLNDLSALGADLRAAMVRAALTVHLDG